MAIPSEELAALATPGPLTGKTYVLTGTFESLSREQAVAALEGLGAKVAGSVKNLSDRAHRGADQRERVCRSGQRTDAVGLNEGGA
jgi:DNA ligase (NAD+)